MKRTKTAPVAPVELSTDLNDPKVFEEHSIKELRAHGFRITMPRVQVIRALGDSKTALSAYAIHEKIIEGGGKIDVVSVYRIIATLCEVGLIHPVGIAGGYFPNRVSVGARQTEVFMNEADSEILELKLPDAVIAAIEKQAKEHGFEATLIKVEIAGTTRAK